jgi:hypothetical protein
MAQSDPTIYPQFKDLINTLVEHTRTGFKASKNDVQPKWFEPSEDTSSRIKLTEKLDRKEINEAYKVAMEKAGDTSEAAAQVMALQHDFIAGAARDLFHRRRGRLHRLAARTSVYEGLQHDRGVLRETVTGYLQGIIENNP